MASLLELVLSLLPLSELQLSNHFSERLRNNVFKEQYFRRIIIQNSYVSSQLTNKQKTKTVKMLQPEVTVKHYVKTTLC